MVAVMFTRKCGRAAFFLMAAAVLASAQGGANDTIWTPLFNGQDLNNWDKKIRGSAVNVDTRNTFRVSPCQTSPGNCLTVDYSGYTNFSGEPFGHIGYKVRPYSYYVIRAEYEFFGTQVSGGPPWALQNNGLMLHSQSAASMSTNQDFPTSMETQLLGPQNTGAGCGGADMNLCTPGTHFHTAPTGGSPNTSHCVCAASGTRGTGWRNVSAVVMSDSIIRHRVGSQTVFTYYRPILDNGTPLKGGYILLQAESHPIRFRKVEVASLVGCKSNTNSPNYRSYYVKDSAQACAATPIRSAASGAGQALAFNAGSKQLFVNLQEDFSLKLTDLAGKTVWEAKGRGNRAFDLTAVRPKGIYFLTLNRRQGVFSQKLLLGN